MNECQLIGNCGRSPELKYTGGGSAICNFSVAVKESWGEGQDRKEKTLWFNISMFGKNAERWAAIVKKGDEVFIKGKMQPREYEDKSGQKRNAFEIHATWVRVTDSKADRPQASGQTPSSGGGRYANQPNSPDNFNSNLPPAEDIPW